MLVPGTVVPLVMPSSGNAVFPIHADIDVTVAANGQIDFDLPLGTLDALLGDDIISFTATLPDGQPLPSWLHFDAATGKFAGVVPQDILTGSIPPDGGTATPPNASNNPPSITRLQGQYLDHRFHHQPLRADGGARRQARLECVAQRPDVRSLGSGPATP